MVSRYRQKRDPSRTNEPFSAEQAHRKNETRAGRFVVHQHAARRMHWDLRLPGRGGLLSFAIPRGPSLNPAEKRLAVHTEDHPSDYLEFEEVIPEGNYGAGAMIIWDTGGVTYVGDSAEKAVDAGKIDFVLDGFKLHGRFSLVATGRRKAKTGLAGTDKASAEWLLIKKPDEASKDPIDVCAQLDRSVLSGLTVKELKQKTEVAARLEEIMKDAGAQRLDPSRPAPKQPMVCATSGAPETSPHWLYELKLDGVRIVASKMNGRAKLEYRSLKNATASYPEIARAVESLAPDNLVLDGEIVTFDAAGQPNFQRLAPRIHAWCAADVERARLQVPVVYLVFDLLELGPWDLRELPLVERKRLLAELVKGKGFLRVLDHIEERGDALWELIEERNLEGMVAKRTDSPYRHGPRASGEWVKVKRAQDDEFVVFGFTEGKGARGAVGALCIASFRNGVLVDRGRVGSGMDDRTLKDLKVTLEELHARWQQQPGPNVDGSALEGLRTCRRIAPELVVRVRFQGYTDGGQLRAPVFLGLRDDVEPATCTAAPKQELLESEEAAPLETTGGHSIESLEDTVVEAASVKVPFSNWEKVFWPEEGYTKGDLVRYYAAVADVMLPFLRERPVVLVRYPDGIHGKSFYQWRVPAGTPEWIDTFELYDEEKQKERGTNKNAFLVEDVDTLLYLANLGCIPLHVLASRRGTPGACDFLTVDLDLGSRPFRDAVVLGLSLREILEELSLPGYPKTSGKTGLHIVVPLGPNVGFDSAKLLCELLGRVLVGRHPDFSTMERRKDKRDGKVYVDTGQTGRSRTIVAPYSVRAVTGATVSTPLDWNELHLALDPSKFDLQTVPKRVHALDDPWADLLEKKPDLSATMKKLASWSGE